MHRSSPILEAMPIADTPDINGLIASAPVRQVHGVLTACLARLDALEAPVAAAHLSACLDTLQRDFNLD